MTVYINGVCQAGKCRLVKGAFCCRPSKIPSAHSSIIDLFPSILTDVIYKDPSRFLIDGKSKRITQTIRPDSSLLFASSRERVTGGNRSVFVDSEQLSMISIQILSVRRI